MPDTSAAASAPLSFPIQYARTQRYTRGVPRGLTATADGGRVLFLRSGHGTDPVGRLWSLDVATGEERLLADPSVLLTDAAEELSPAERARRERLREGSSGIVGFATDRSATVAAFALSSRLWVTDLRTSDTRELPASGSVIDPRPDPTGSWVAYAGDRALHVVRVDGSDPRVLAAPEHDDISWGVAEFVASEEMDRYRGYWWSPDGSAVLASRVDEAPVQRWYIADPANPATVPTQIAYPAAGTDNAVVDVHILGLDGSRVAVAWDNEAFPYLITAHWSDRGDPLLEVMSRDQRHAQVLAVDAATGATRVVAEQRDDTWVDVVPGTLAWLPDARLLCTVERGGARRLLLGDTEVDLGDATVEHVVSTDDDGVLVAATDDPTEAHLWHVALDGRATRLSGPGGYHVGVLSRRHTGRRQPNPGRAGRHGRGTPGRRGRRDHRLTRRSAGPQNRTKVDDRRRARPQGGGCAPPRPHAGHPAAGADESLRRAASPRGGRGAQHVARVAVVRRPGLRGRGSRRTWGRVREVPSGTARSSRSSPP